MARLRVFILGLCLCIGGSPYPDPPSETTEQPVALRRRSARAVSTAARFNDALTEPTTQRKAACFTSTVDSFRESVARMARRGPQQRTTMSRDLVNLALHPFSMALRPGIGLVLMFALTWLVGGIFRNHDPCWVHHELHQDPVSYLKASGDANVSGRE
jgi:hypothetical protein